MIGARRLDQLGVCVHPDDLVAARVQNGTDPALAAPGIEDARSGTDHRVDQPSLSTQVGSLRGECAEPLGVGQRVPGRGVGDPAGRRGHACTLATVGQAAESVSLRQTTTSRTLVAMTQTAAAAPVGRFDRDHPHYKWVALSNTTLGMSMATINASIVLISLPAIFRGIGLDPLGAGQRQLPALDAHGLPARHRRARGDLRAARRHLRPGAHLQPGLRGLRPRLDRARRSTRYTGRPARCG